MVSFPQVLKFFKLRARRANQGFTLIELLVAMIISSIVLVSLLGFMNTILNTSRREEAKAASEREIQDALDLLSDDINQSVYIYDDISLYGGTRAGSTTAYPGIHTTTANQLPDLPNLAAAQETPVLVLWRRTSLSRDACVTLDTNSQVVIPTYSPASSNPCPGTRRISVGCLSKLSGATTPIDPATECSNQDYLPYSLVVYYLTSRGTGTVEGNLSNTVQLRRLELRDGLRSSATVSGTTCASPAPAGTDGCRLETITGTTTTIPVYYLLMPDQGFQRFDVSSATSIDAGMASWTRYSTGGATYPTAPPLNANIVIDFVDQSGPTVTNLDIPAANCPAGFGRVPDYSETVINTSFPRTTGFYACVDSVNTVAIVYLRGNALARMSSRLRTPPLYSSTASSFFPIANTTIRGRGFLNINANN